MEHNINFGSTYFVKLVRRGARFLTDWDWTECIIHKNGDSYLRIVSFDNDAESLRMSFADFERSIEEGKIVENVDGNYYIATYECYEPLCGNVYLHHSAHYVKEKMKGEHNA